MDERFGQRVTELMRRYGLNQRILAERVGTTPVSMSRYINGTRHPTGPIIEKMAAELNTTMDYLLKGEIKTEDLDIMKEIKVGGRYYIITSVNIGLDGTARIEAESYSRMKREYDWEMQHEDENRKIEK
ncbi:MAG: helix-turn-helix transcriptional regulator [Bacteroidales bacterium]|nr:helix-turn-helix transcriptional regulator [Bacteroidales bacterium]